MPEIIEVEAYRKAISATVGRTVSRVHAPDEWFAKGDTTTDALRLELTGARVLEVRRRGKLVIVDTDGPRLGLRFGMTGKIVVDGTLPIDHLLYDSPRHDPSWDRFGLQFTDGGAIVVRDPRRLGGVQLDPNEAALGPDAFSLTLGQLRDALGRSTIALKARLLDQKRVAGLGNLLVDEALWRAGLAPVRPAGSLEPAETARLHSGHPPNAEHPRRTGRFPHRRPAAGPGPRRRLPPRRGRAAPRAGGRPHHLLVPRASDVTAGHPLGLLGATRIGATASPRRVVSPALVAALTGRSGHGLAPRPANSRCAHRLPALALSLMGWLDLWRFAS